jgi:DivIVA domain-containing protein
VLTVLAVLASVAVLFAAGALITHEGDVLLDAPADAPDLDLPSGQLQPEDVPQLRFGLALRGYRMEEVDSTLARVARELTARDQHITQLQRALSEVEPVSVPAALLEPPAPEPEQAAWPAPEAPRGFWPPPETAALGSQEASWPQQEWPDSTSAVSETAGQVHAPTPEPLEDLFPEIAPPEPDVPAPVSSFGMYDRVPPDEDAPLGQPGVGFAASGGGTADPV